MHSQDSLAQKKLTENLRPDYDKETRLYVSEYLWCLSLLMSYTFFPIQKDKRKEAYRNVNAISLTDV